MRGVLPRRPVKTGAVLYLRATAALILPLVVDVVVPAVLVRGSGAHVEGGGYYLFGTPLIVFGCGLLFDSVFLRFAREGRGTLAPIDPPRFVVRGGAYRIIRNPMYVANVAIVVGSAAMFRSPQLLAWAVGILLAFHVFVVAYEEPTLRRLFGEDYDTYRRDVGRWIPRRRDRSTPRHEERS
jgi:protein-S-isoprenylcysteine O-methyltransferase Ste14